MDERAPVAADEFRVYAIRYARRDGRRGQHFLGYDERWDEPHPTAYFVWLAVSVEHTVVVDAGIEPNRAGELDGLDYLASPIATLGELGIGAASVDHVVLTHLHYDHTGTAHEFGSARYVVQQSELDYWTGPWARRVAREQWLVDDNDVERLRTAAEAGRVTLVDGDATVVPGVSVHLVGGHTAGMQVVRVRTARGHAVLASDAGLYYENLDEDRPFPILHSMTGVYHGFDRVNELVDDPDLVVAGHDPEVLERYPAASATLAGRVALIA